MGDSIHPAAVVDPSAEIGAGVKIGAYAIVGADVVLGDDTEIGASAQVMGPSTLGKGNTVYPNACIGFDPQDLKFAGERTTLEVGDGNAFREFCTVNRGTAAGGGRTSIGSENLFMAYTHVAHDSHVGDRTVFSNGGTLAGHVEVHDDAVVGANSAVHQFCRVGRHAYIGGYSVVTQDALPFAKTVGHRPAVYGLNKIGLERKGFSPEDIKALDHAFRVLLRGGHAIASAVELIRADANSNPHVEYLVEFIESSTRGVIRSLPGRRRSRGSSGE